MSKLFHLITMFFIIVLAFFTVLFSGISLWNIFEELNGYTFSEDSMIYALEDGRYGDLVENYHKNLVADVKSTETMEECYAIARYYESAIDYKIALLENDLEAQKLFKEKMNTAAKEMGDLSYAEKEINELLGL